MKLKPLLFSIILVLQTANLIFAQNKYFIKIKDKNNSPYSLENPSEFLSERAIERRSKQGISIKINDLPVNPDYIDQISGTGAKIDYCLKWFNGVVITTSSPDILISIQKLPFVNYIQNIYRPTLKKSEINIDEKNVDSKLQSKSILEFDYGTSFTQINMLNGQALHSNGFLGDGMLIAVLDAGFYAVHTHSAFDSLRIHRRILGTKDFINPNSDIYQEHKHGMMTLSTMGAYKAGRLIGTAPHSNYWLIRTEDANSEQLHEEYAWAAGAEFADSIGADIINSSLGYTEFDVSTQSHKYEDLDGNSTPVTIAANIAASKGMVIVVSAGNEGDDPWHFISAPSDSPYVLTVGALDSNGEKAMFSSFGPSADGRTKPDICAMGQAAVVASANGNISFADGTSFSAPIISGMIACLWQARPNLTSNEIIELIKTNSSNANSPNNSIGYGIPNFSTMVSVGTQIINSSSISIFPNPFKNVINAHIPNAQEGIVEYTIISIIGEIIVKNKKEVVNHQLEIKLPASISHGNYIIRINTGSRVYFAKAIKN